MTPEAQPTTVPEDGLSTRQRRNRPLLAVHTGDMKGKSTAAFGMALRAWNSGLPVAVYQFVKSGKWRVGEEAALRALDKVHERTGQGAPVLWQSMGAGWSWQRKQGTDADHAADALEGWRQVQRDLVTQAHGFYVLDEFTYPMTWGWVDVDEVVATLRDRPGFQHVVVTGRAADPRLVEVADLVLRTEKVKHPMDAGQSASGASSGRGRSGRFGQPDLRLTGDHREHRPRRRRPRRAGRPARRHRGHPREIAGDHVALVVNVARKCGLTPQYAGLERAAGAVRRRGLHRGRPAVQPVRRPGARDEPRRSRVLLGDVRRHLPDDREDRGQRRGRHPLYAGLVETPDEKGRDRRHRLELREVPRRPDGAVVARFGPQVEPEDERLVAVLERALQG